MVSQWIISIGTSEPNPFVCNLLFIMVNIIEMLATNSTITIKIVIMVINTVVDTIVSIVIIRNVDYYSTHRITIMQYLLFN